MKKTVDIEDELKQVYQKFVRAHKKQDLDSKRIKLSSLNLDINNPDFWQDPERATRISQQAGQLDKALETWDKVLENLDLASEIVTGLGPDLDQYLVDEVRAVIDQAEVLIQESRFDGKHDQDNAVVTISAGVGGVDAMDWAEILSEIYFKWAKRHQYQIELISKSPGDEAGIKSIQFEVAGLYAYGWMARESGVHRLIRMSPFNSDNLRQTSFALVEVLPLIEQVEVEIDPNDLRIDTYRSSGHGGQSVNTTDSAVRVTHLPTGIVVAIQNEKSQLKNKELAMKLLYAKLEDLAERQHLKDLSQLKSQDKSASWGEQIRTYTFQPYQLIKDHRTGVEVKDLKSIMAGEIDNFMLK
ncbi:peptide chain release factor 2 [Candidatus Saccharibacteria bacterium]|nr:peptide chain release factor 2 [Candidatus Saccharibacteria bacterium]